MKNKVIEIGKELYEDLNALFHTDSGTASKYDMKMDKLGVMKFIELFATRIDSLYLENYEKRISKLEKPAQISEGEIENHSLNLLTLLSNAAGAEFEDESMALELIKAAIKELNKKP
jgi:hypothetical protein